jgi:hypothetical protein
MHCRAQVKFGLHVVDVGETDVNALRLEKFWKTGCESVKWCPTGVEGQRTIPKLTSAWDWVEDRGGLSAPSCVFG